MHNSFRYVEHRPGGSRILKAVCCCLLPALVSCGGGGGSSFSVECSPSPDISSTPPATATAGYNYRYVIDAVYLCSAIPPVTCHDVHADKLPSGASITGGNFLSWTPAANLVNTTAKFEIATKSDPCGDKAHQSWKVKVLAPPVVESFTAQPAAVSIGESTRLVAVFEGVGIIETIGAVTSGVPVSTGPLDKTTDFTLNVTNSQGAVASHTLSVEALHPPEIQSLNAVPPTVAAGDSSSLRWSLAGDISEARLDPPGVDVLALQFYDVIPAATTSYRLFVTNASGASASESVQVTVVPPPGIESFTATPPSSVLRGTVLLTPVFAAGAGEIEIETGTGTYALLSAVTSGDPIDSGELLRSTTFRLMVRNAAGTEASETLFVPITGPGTFQPAKGQPLFPQRREHTATRLADGRVFVAGGRIDGESSVSTEIFDPVTEQFTAGPDLLEGRFNQADARLPDGRVLLIGGYRTDTTRIHDAEIYDPGSGTVLPAGTVNATDLVMPEAVGLLDGRVLVVHGSIGQGAEVFDPATETFTAAGPFVGGHGCIRAERLANGGALVIDGSPANAAELFMPGTDSFAATDAVAHSRCYFASAVLPDGRVLVTGYDLPAEVYDPATGMFTDAGIPEVATSGPTANTLTNGFVLVAGGSSAGFDSPWAETFDPVTETYARTGGLREGHRFHSATVLEDGRVLVIGGCTNSPCTAELYTPE